MGIDRDEEDSALTIAGLEMAIDILTPRQQAVVALKIAGFSQKDGEALTGMNRATLGLIYRRAKKILKHALSK